MGTSRSPWTATVTACRVWAREWQRRWTRSSPNAPQSVSTLLLPQTPEPSESLLFSVEFYLQVSIFYEWSRGGSNPYPPPCKVRAFLSCMFVVVQKHLQNRTFAPGSIRLYSLLFVWVGVLLV